MITRLRQRLTRPVINHDDSGSMLLALFVIIILTSLVSVVLMVSIHQQAKTRKATDFTFAGQAADTAVNDALMTANNAVGRITSGEGVTAEFRWHWDAVYPDPDPEATLSTMEITATGCRNNAASTGCMPNSQRKIKATLSGVAYESAANSKGEVTYVLTPKKSFNRALFADQDLIMQDLSKVASYSSTTGRQNTGVGQVATNDLADFGPNVDLNGIYMLNTQAHASDIRCNRMPFGSVKSQCDPLRTPRLIHDIGPKLQITDTPSPLPPTFITEQIAKPPCVLPLTAWVASKSSPTKGRLPQGIQCYSSMTFDWDTTLVGTAEVYVTGPITVAPGSFRINMNSATTPLASKLQIFSSGPVVSLGGGAASSARTEVAWALWAPNARCAPSKPTGFVTVYGAMVCQTIFTQGGFIAQWDEALRTLPPAAGSTLSEGAGTAWDIGAYEDGT